MNKNIQSGLIVVVVILLGYLGYSFKGQDVEAPEIISEDVVTTPDGVYVDDAGQLTIDSIKANDIALNIPLKMGGLDYTIARALVFKPINSDITERTILNITSPKDLSFGILPHGYKSGLIFEVNIENNDSVLHETNLEDLFQVSLINDTDNNFDVFLYSLGASTLEAGETDTVYIAFAIPVEAVSVSALVGQGSDNSSSLRLSLIDDTYSIK